MTSTSTSWLGRGLHPPFVLLSHCFSWNHDYLVSLETLWSASFQTWLIHFNCPSLAGNHIIAFPLTSAQSVQAALQHTAHSPSPAPLAGRCYPSLANFPALATLPGPCSLFQHPLSKAQMREGQILGCRGVQWLSNGEVNALDAFLTKAFVSYSSPATEAQVPSAFC